MSEAAAVKGVLESFIEHAQEPHFTGEKSGKAYRREVSTPQWKAIGVLYAKLTDGVVSFEVLYEHTVEQVVKDEIAARWGAGAHEWRER